ncbi:hypothetical protein [Aquimarina sp. Aq78]|uniref:hypothetical protein n=1 Tax=Aquimarina sp. Aq78 TaxID=1191889 RepID=UPI000D0F66D6|nr:hypothetical protein [Aquimarina sp. Aq78]
MKNLNNLGKVLPKKEQKTIFGGLYIAAPDTCSKNSDCSSGVCATFEKQTGRYPAGRHCL